MWVETVRLVLGAFLSSLVGVAVAASDLLLFLVGFVVHFVAFLRYLRCSGRLLPLAVSMLLPLLEQSLLNVRYFQDHHLYWFQ